MTQPELPDPAAFDVGALEQALAPWAMRSAQSRGRVHPEDEHPYRSVFQRDRDRIIHSTAFRRLEYKTQVFVNHEGDHYRTRLTHTLEVAQIARVIARALRLNECLTEAIALAHDLGHTPFGHSGEEALNELMQDHGGFEHNRHGLRVVDHLEHRYPDFPGINLSYEVREGFASHSTRHDFPRHRTDFADAGQSTLEAQVVSLADEIAYDNHDLDDGLGSGILAEGEVRELAVWKRAEELAGRETAALPEGLRRALLIRKIIDLEVTSVLTETARNLRSAGISDVDGVRAHRQALAACDGEVAAMKDELEAFLAERLYSYYTVRRMAGKARAMLGRMFEAYRKDISMLPPEHQELCRREGLERAICDYIAGMTDRFAQQETRKLFHPDERV